MEVIYESKSHKNICELERRLVERFHLGVTLGGYHHNAVGGGGGRKPAPGGSYYLYLISAPMFARMYRI